MDYPGILRQEFPGKRSLAGAIGPGDDNAPWLLRLCSHAFRFTNNKQGLTEATARRKISVLCLLLLRIPLGVFILHSTFCALHLDQSSGRSPAGAIFTSFGSNWPWMVTRSLCAAITSRMFLYTIGTSSNPAE